MTYRARQHHWYHSENKKYSHDHAAMFFLKQQQQKAQFRRQTLAETDNGPSEIKHWRIIDKVFLVGLITH